MLKGCVGVGPLVIAGICGKGVCLIGLDEVAVANVIDVDGEGVQVGAVGGRAAELFVHLDVFVVRAIRNRDAVGKGRQGGFKGEVACGVRDWAVVSRARRDSQGGECTRLSSDVGTELQGIAVVQAVGFAGIEAVAVDHGAVHGALVGDVDAGGRGRRGGEHGVVAGDGRAVDEGVPGADHELRLRGVLGGTADLEGGARVEGKGAGRVLVELVGAAERDVDGCGRVSRQPGGCWTERVLS